jgi:CRISPR-associated protein Cas1
MTGPWRVVDLTRYDGPVAASRGHVRVSGDGTVPLADVVTVLTGPRCEFHASVLERAAAYHISLVHCDWRGAPVAATYGWSTHTRVGARQRAQAELSVPRQKNAWMQIVRAKIKGQALGSRSSGVEDPATCTVSQDRSGRETLRISKVVRRGCTGRDSSMRVRSGGCQEVAVVRMRSLTMPMPYCEEHAFVGS